MALAAGESFIGSENRLFSLSGSSVIASPWRDGEGRVVGVVGVIGPTRLNYARVVPMDGRPHLPASVRQLHGDPRGHWEGDALVVETTNFINGFQGSTNNVKLTERFTRPERDFLNWEITVNDPDTWVQPWTFMIRLKHVDEQIYEYACHEGNYAVPNMLRAARLEESSAPPSGGK